MCELTSFTRRTLVGQWVFGITLGHEDLNDHDELRSPAVACRDLAAGQDDPIFAGAVATPETTIAIPWTVSAAAPVNGIAHVPAHNTPMKPGRREVLLIAIAKARKWIKNVERGQSFAEIARWEGQAERHVRHLSPLAFVSPRIITAIINRHCFGRAHRDGTRHHHRSVVAGDRGWGSVACPYQFAILRSSSGAPEVGTFP